MFMSEAARKEIYRHFAALLSYPDKETGPRAQNCLGLLATLSPEGAEKLKEFVDFSRINSDSRLEEVYTATFDLQPFCYPYVGYQLCGENQKRALFLMQLQRLYREQGFAASAELPDHLSEILRFIGGTANRLCRQEIISDGVIPALEKILTGLDTADQAYRPVLEALFIFLNEPGDGKGEVS